MMIIYRIKDANEGSLSIYATGIRENAIKEADRLANQRPDKYFVVVKLEEVYSTYKIEE